MSKRILVAGTLALLTAAGAARAEDVKAELKPGETQFKSFFDAGQIVKGLDGETGKEYKMQAFRRTLVLITKSGKLSEKIDVKMGMLGAFFFVLPEQDGAPHTRLPKFVLFPTNAELIWHMGDAAAPLADLEVGAFQYKYNPEASNLGEYLLRSGTYPGYLLTGGFNMINSANYQVYGAGLHVNLMEGKFKTDFLLPMENMMPPMHSISPTVVTSFKGLPGIDLGAGVCFNHLISAKPSKEAFAAHDPNASPDYMRWPTSIIKSADSTTVVRDTTQFYTFQGTKLMGRLTLDPKEWMDGTDAFKPADLKLFAEAAVLGVKDYPFYYPDISRRIPVMFGMNLPTFGLLDLLSVQGEYFNALWQNNIDGVFEFQRPVPYHKDYDPVNGPETVAKEVKDDRIHWSVLAKRELLKGANLYLQVASDHLRTYDYNFKPIKTPITSRPGDWYYLFRLELAI